jgi:hypothetical protein
MTRNGKIARLPRAIRHTLNQRLEDGEQAKDLVQWLNGLPEVQTILSRDFSSRPVNEQNFSDWKQGGFLDWQRQQDACDNIRRLIEHSATLDDAAEAQSIPDLLASLLAAELAGKARKLLEETADPSEQWQYLRQALRQLHLLRIGEHRAVRARIEMERWEIECERREQEEARRQTSQAVLAVTAPLRDAIRRMALVKACGEGPDAEKTVDLILELERIAAGAASPTNQSDPSPPSDQAQSR